MAETPFVSNFKTFVWVLYTKPNLWPKDSVNGQVLILRRRNPLSSVMIICGSRGRVLQLMIWRLPNLSVYKDFFSVFSQRRSILPSQRNVLYQGERPMYVNYTNVSMDWSRRLMCRASKFTDFIKKHWFKQSKEDLWSWKLNLLGNLRRRRHCSKQSRKLDW
jgi:hypothetical protein